jgi:hypothetical protein
MSKKLILLLLFSAAACELPESIKTLSEDQDKELSELSTELQAEALKFSACQENRDCKVEGFAPNPCGSFDQFIVASQRSNKDGSLSARSPSNDYYLFIGRLRIFQNRIREENRENGSYGLCVVPPEVKGVCVESKCSTVPLEEYLNGPAI